MVHERYDYLFKFLIVGDSNVGKTAILQQFFDHKFPRTNDATVGVDFKNRLIKIDGKLILLMVWDTAGQESYRSFTRTYYRGVGIAILTYDVTNSKSFENIPSWLDEIKNNCDNPNLEFVLVGNKSDLNEKRQVAENEGRKFAEENNLLFFETSAKDNSNVEELFNTTTDNFYRKFQQGLLDITNDSQGLTLGPKSTSSGGSCLC